MTSYITTTRSTPTTWGVSHHVTSTSTVPTSTTISAPAAAGEECDAGWEQTGVAQCEEPGWDRNLPGFVRQPAWQLNTRDPTCRPDICMIIARDEASLRSNRFSSERERLAECNIVRVRTGLTNPPGLRNNPCTTMPVFRTQLDRIRFMRNNLQVRAEQAKIYCDPYIYRNCGCVCEPEPKCPPCGGVYREPLQTGGTMCGCST